MAPIVAQKDHATNLILVTVDGLRWQELFGGADTRLMNKDAAEFGTSSRSSQGFGVSRKIASRIADAVFLEDDFSTGTVNW